jgi:hypothetical protein
LFSGRKLRLREFKLTISNRKFWWSEGERTELLARDIENYEQKLPTKFSPRFEIVHLFNAASVEILHHNM